MADPIQATKLMFKHFNIQLNTLYDLLYIFESVKIIFNRKWTNLSWYYDVRFSSAKDGILLWDRNERISMYGTSTAPSSCIYRCSIRHCVFRRWAKLYNKTHIGPYEHHRRLKKGLRSMCCAKYLKAYISGQGIVDRKTADFWTLMKAFNQSHVH